MITLTSSSIEAYCLCFFNKKLLTYTWIFFFCLNTKVLNKQRDQLNKLRVLNINRRVKKCITLRIRMEIPKLLD